MFTKNLLKILAYSFSLLMILPFSSSVMYSVDFILLEKRGFAVAQNLKCLSDPNFSNSFF